MNKQKLLVLVIVVVILLGVGYYYFINVQDQEPVTPETSVQTPTEPWSDEYPWKSVDEELAYLHEKSVVEITTPTQNSPVVFSQLPENFQFFIPDESKSTAKFSRATFQDGKSGFITSFDYQANLVTAHNFYRKYTVSEYDYLDGKKTPRAGIYIVQDTSYLYWMDFTVLADDVTKVTVTAKQK